MANVRSRLSASESLLGGQPYLRSMLAISEVAQGGLPKIHSQLLAVEVAQGGAPRLHSQFAAVETAQGGLPSLRSQLLVVEVLQKVLEEQMSTDVFPTLQGLAFDVQKKPIFSSKVAEHTSGEETATSYYQNPKWEFTLTYDYLPDIPQQVGDTDLQTLMGFFLNRHGRWDTFLYQEPDYHTVTAGYQKDFDGTSVEFDLVRSIGGFYEPVGQLNQDLSLTVWLALTESGTVPATGPYTFTVSQAAAYAQTDSVTINGVAATLATGAPAAGQYAVAAGVYTFNSADHGKAIVVRYRYLVDPSAYTVTLPNVVTFTSAPPDLATAYASFDYYYQCRFLEDSSQFTKFMDKLWNLQEMGFRSIPS